MTPASLAALAVAFLAAGPPVVSSAATHDLGKNSEGQLAFIQRARLRAGAATASPAHQELYPVQLNFDIELLEAHKGVTMVFDKQSHIMQLDAGISVVNGLAWGHYNDNIDKTGWAELFLETTSNDDVSNDVRMYSAGVIEGLLTCVRLSQYYYNLFGLTARREGESHSLKAMKSLFKNEVAYMKVKANLERHLMTEEPKDAYWKHARYILFQLWGVADGFNKAAGHFNVPRLDLEDMVFLNSGGELPALFDAYSPPARAARAAAQAAAQAGMVFLQGGEKRSRSNATIRAHGGALGREDPLDDAHWERRMARDGHCSAFVRVSEGNQDLLMGHSTWDDYSKMTRIFKYYNFPLRGAETMASHIAFSSYPGTISSTDDYYVMNSGISVMDTSLELLNPNVWEAVEDFPLRPHIPNFVHIMAVNRLAKSAPHWARLIQSQNTGTYNSQWIVLDYNQFKVGSAVADGTLWVIETMPGMTEARDMSYYLRSKGYWPSMNRPFFDKTREASGHDAAQKSHGALYSWADNPRGKLFAGAAKSINTLFDMRGLMGRNLYPFAGVVPNEPGHEISARMDLSPSNPIPNGGIDSKVTNRCLAAAMQLQARSGPTHAGQSVFRWLKPDSSEIWPGWPHKGQPNEWGFDYVQMTATTSTPLVDIYDC